MDDTFAPRDDAARKGLAETIAWCAGLEILADVEETEDARLQRETAKQAAKLIQRAYLQRNSFWNRFFHRDFSKSSSFRRGMELYRQADLTYAPLKDQLRSRAICPTGTLSDARTDNERKAVVRSVVSKRSALVSAGEYDPRVDAGKLLLYVPAENLADGAARYASKGFFDDDNTPPWDTWADFSEGTLVSWVPPQLVVLAQKGIDANPECCLRWFV
jgi:hypothetical protein